MAAAPSSLRPRVAVYLGGLLQGLVVVSYPASSTVLRALHDLDDTDYGSLFIPQTVMTIVGSLAGGFLASRVGLARLLAFAMGAATASAATLAAAAWVPSSSALTLLLVGTGLMGLGFGLAAAPLNTMPGRLFPERPQTALVALHTIVGVGFSLGPLGVGLLVDAGHWIVFPITLVAGCLALTVLSAVGRFSDAKEADEGAPAELAPLAPGPLIALAAMAVLYAFAEGTFSNWAAVFLHEERSVEEGTATLAISGFWIGLTVGRLGVSALLSRVKAEVVWLALPLAMAAVFLLLPLATGAASGIALFVLAGLTCSAFFPLTVGQANARYQGREAFVSSVLTAALMIGVGGGSYLLGALRSMWELPTLYRISSLYPVVALAVGVALVTRGRASTLGAAAAPKGPST